ncbi:MAG TPA: histidine phosphatase family protein [Dongiaceae bacterium]|nr:histidine phosphatase family protein [Dongiaceae bacterium]
MTELIVIRHAPTPWNRAKRLQGRSNIALDDEGRALAARWRPAAQAWEAWQILSSPLQRARETAALLFPGRPVRVDPRLIEMDFGTWEGKTLRDLRAMPGGDAAQRELLGLDFHAPGGESPRQVQARLQPLLLDLAAAGRETVAVAHKAVLRALYAQAAGWDMTAKPPQKIHANCAHHFRLAAAGRPAVAHLNVVQLNVVRMNLPLLPPAGPAPAADETEPGETGGIDPS